MPESLMSERMHIVATIDPDNYVASTVGSDAWDMQKYRQAMVIVQSGAVAATGTLDWKLKESATSNGTFTTMTGKGTATPHTTTYTDSQSILNISSKELAATTVTGARWCKLHMTVGTTTVFASAVVLAERSRFKEPFTTISYSDLATVIEIVP
jgi:hypothetical protein